MKRSIIVLAILLAVVIARPVQAAPTVKDLETELMCQCGCGMVVVNCDCGTANQIRDLISQKIQAGESKGQIIKYFVSQYGEKVLSTPPKKGFNLTVWVMPEVAIVGGGGILYFVLRRWVWTGKQAESLQTEPGSDSPEELDDYHARLEKELRDYEEEDS